MDPQTNVSIMHSSPELTCAQYDQHTNDCQEHSGPDDNASPASAETSRISNLQIRPKPVAFTTDTLSPSLTEEEFHEAEDNIGPRQLFLKWHYRLNHLGWGRMKRMVDAGLLLAKLLQARPPKCAACLIGKATRRPWRTKVPLNKRTIPAIVEAGDCVSVDQLQSTTPGLIGQLLSGFMTKQRYHYATIFVDHKTNLGYVHLQRTSNADETIQAKEAFESFARVRGVIVRHYHANNGRFSEKAWTNHCLQHGQTLSFCGVNAHHSNGIAEKRIRDLQEAARAALIHAKRRWPSAITTNLWPYALCTANHVHNCVVSSKTGKIPLLQDFCQVGEPSINLQSLHPFGCPVYCLDSDLANGRKQKPTSGAIELA